MTPPEIIHGLDQLADLAAKLAEHAEHDAVRSAWTRHLATVNAARRTIRHHEARSRVMTTPARGPHKLRPVA